MSWLSAPIYGEFNSPYIAKKCRDSLTGALVKFTQLLIQFSMISEDRLSHCSISSVEQTVHKICVLFCRKVAEKNNNNIEMLVKTVYRTVLSHLWTEIFPKIAFFLQKSSRKKTYKGFFANFNFSILGGSGGIFFLILFCRKQYKIFVNISFNR